MIASNKNSTDRGKPSAPDVHWLSRGAEELVAGIAQTLHDGTIENCPTFDVLIVGSGYGGAVAAARFAGRIDGASGKEIRVAVLERGREYIPGMFPGRFADLGGHVRISSGDGTGTKGGRLGLFDLKVSPDMSALVGNGLGGGSLINAGVMERPSDSIFDQTNEVKKRRWPAAITSKELHKYLSDAKKILGATQLPKDDGFAEPARLTALAELGKQSGSIARRADITVNFDEDSDVFKPCVRCGDCFTGCNIGAKRSTDTNYLAEAHRRGAEIYTGATVLYLRPDVSSADEQQSCTQRFWRVYFTLTDPKMTCSDPGPFYVLAKRVILAAGTFGSTEILMRSRAFGLGLSPRLGKGFSGNGDMIAVAVNQPAVVEAAADEEIALQSRGIGPTITGLIDMRDRKRDDRRFVIEEMAIPAALRRIFEETVTTFGSLYALADRDPSEHKPFGPDDVDSAAIDPAKIQRTAVYAMMGIDSANGQFEFPPAAAESLRDGWLVVRWPQVHGPQSLSADSLYQQQIDCLQELQAKLPVAKGKTPPKVIPYPLWRPLPGDMAQTVGLDAGPLFTVHPLGGCSMGEDIGSGVVDDIGRVFDSDSDDGPYHEGLVVLDGSIVPCALGTNPALTIAALAERSCEALKAHWNLREESSAARLPAIPARPMRSPPPPSRNRTSIQLAERMTGKVKMPDGETRYLAITLEFEVIPKLMDFIRKGQKKLTVIPTSSYVQVYARREQMNAPPNADPVKSEHISRIKHGSFLEYLQREPGAAKQGMWRRRYVYVRNRLLRDVWSRSLKGILLLAKPESPVASGPRKRWWRRYCDYVVGISRLLSQVREVRTLKYDLTLESGVAGGLEANGRLIGTKTIVYSVFGNPWRQLMEMPLDYIPPPPAEQQKPHPAPQLKRRLTKREPLRIDLGYFAQRQQPLLNVVHQTDAPTTWADLVSLGLYLSRIIGRIHFFSFRAPDERGVGWKQNLAARLPSFIAQVPEPQVAELHSPDLDPQVTELRNSDLTAQGRFVRLARYVPARRSRLQWLRGVLFRRPRSLLRLLSRPIPRPLFRGRRETARRNPVVLLHGFGASGSTFAHRSIQDNLVQLLTRRGCEAWVVELRTSVGLLSSRQAFDFEKLASKDVVAAIDEVRYRTGAEEVDVVAHCVGAAMFCLATLSGQLKGKVGAAVLSQVGPMTVFHRDNVFRGYMAAYLRRFIGAQIFDVDVAPCRSNAQRALDRALSTFPYADEEVKYEYPWFWRRPHSAIRHRADAIFGQLYASRNVPNEVTERLDELIGHVHVDSMAQLMFYARHRQLTSRDGLRSLLDREKVRDNFEFPILFLFGSDNRVFDKAGIDESLKLLYEQFATQAGESSPFQREIFKGLGHQDGLIGPRLASEVFPAIDRFLYVKRPKPPIPRAVVKIAPATPRFGPVIGWLKAAANNRMEACIALGAPVLRGTQWNANVDLEKAPLNVIRRKRIPDPDDSMDLTSDTHHALASVEHLKIDVTDLRESKTRYAHVRRGGLEREDTLRIGRSALRAIDDPGMERTGIRFALGSCQYPAGLIDRDIADASFDRLHKQLNSTKPPQFLILAGDQIYVDETAGLFDVASSVERHVRPYESFYARRAIRNVMTRLPVYCMLDDHEIVDNWEPPLVTDKRGKTVQREAFAAFEAYQWNMGPGPDFQDIANLEGPAPNGRRRYWYHFAPGGFGTFMMDTRTERDRRTLRRRYYDFEEDQQRHGQVNVAKIVSDEQFLELEKWLEQMQTKDELAPKFVVTPSVVFPWYKDVEHNPLYAARCDGWDGFPNSLRRVLSFIANNEIQNVVFLSGDYHLSCIARATITSRGKRPIDVYSIVSSGLYAPYPFANAKPDELALTSAGTWINAGFTCAVETLPLRRKDAAADMPADDRPDMRTVTDEGFAIVEVAHDGGWMLDFEFHAASGVFHRRETLSTRKRSGTNTQEGAVAL